ncbi:uncharacterized protein K452DRAFT_361752 [Aplosporella prunicola CBS 121167]|uniref:Uncharacterized protein n=1 Tax=Aplosporella prunicola CBS 121167 TaxID=1176127 RepID=A0A6A6B1W3_9PEZI|nr:uncharacterized protein K452DRAFT_361752 [Aplosporella prunicola CBS 121167]KAF2137578.1 hypothetical protein K452DRAFT_361752 [Aplosporella prunicola CBS 121167]
MPSTPRSSKRPATQLLESPPKRHSPEKADAPPTEELRLTPSKETIDTLTRIRSLSLSPGVGSAYARARSTKSPSPRIGAHARNKSTNSLPIGLIIALTRSRDTTSPSPGIGTAHASNKSTNPPEVPKNLASKRKEYAWEAAHAR